MSFPRKLSALAVASTMAVTGVTMATPALANTGTSSQPAAAAPAINQVHKETGYFKTTDKLGTQLFYRKDIVPNAKGAVVLVHGSYGELLQLRVPNQEPYQRWLQRLPLRQSWPWA